MRIVLRLWFVVAVVFFSQTSFASAPSHDIEAEYSEAVLDYQTGKSAEALTKLNRVLEKDPQHIKGWELKGLVLKSMGTWNDAVDIYQHLKKVAEEIKMSSDESIPYDFQLASLYMQNRNYNKAKPHLIRCFRKRFNSPAVVFYLGIVALEENKLKQAEEYFKFVTKSEIEALKAPAHFYLAMVGKKKKDATLVDANLQTARELAQVSAEDINASPSARSSARQLMTSIDALIHQPDQAQGHFIAGVGLVLGYDTNVLLNPSVDTGATGLTTPVSTVRYSAGYLTRWLGLDWMPFWQGSINYNFNRSAQAGQYFINDTNLWAYRQSGNWRFGFRVGANLTLKQYLDTGSTTGVMKRQSFSASVGPNYRYNFSPSMAAGSEILYVHNSFFNEESISSSLQKDGWEIRWRNFLQNIDKVGFWNPTFELNLSHQYTVGEEFRSYGARAVANNAYWWNEHLNSSARIGLGYIHYPVRPAGERNDVELTMGVQTGWEAYKNLRLTWDLYYLNNLSNITDIYRYNRWIASMALDYQF